MRIFSALVTICVLIAERQLVCGSPTQTLHQRSDDHALQSRGWNPFTCFGCGWAFQCNPFHCGPGSGSLSHARPHRGTFTYDTAVPSRAVRRIDDNLTVYVDPNADGSLTFHFYLSSLFSLHISNIAGAVRLGNTNPARNHLPNPEPNSHFDIIVPGDTVNAAVLQTSGSGGVISVEIFYELEGELK